MKFIELDPKERDFLNRWLSPKATNIIVNVINFIGKMTIIVILLLLVTSTIVAWVATLIRWIL